MPTTSPREESPIAHKRARASERAPALVLQARCERELGTQTHGGFTITQKCNGVLLTEPAPGKCGAANRSKAAHRRRHPRAPTPTRRRTLLCYTHTPIDRTHANRASRAIYNQGDGSHKSCPQRYEYPCTRDVEAGQSSRLSTLIHSLQGKHPNQHPQP